LCLNLPETKLSQFADEHPSASVLGTDLSPVQPSYVPINCSFLVDDVESDWCYNKKFDYIHGRFLTMGLRDWPRLYKQSFDHLNPGGWIESQEMTLQFDCDDDTCPNRAYATLADDVAAVAAKMGINTRLGDSLGEELDKVGFINRKTVHYRWPIGDWSTDKKEKKMGLWHQKNMLTGVGSMIAFLTRGYGMSREEAEMRITEVRKELNDSSVHQYMTLYIHYAQKPENDQKV